MRKGPFTLPARSRAIAVAISMLVTSICPSLTVSSIVVAILPSVVAITLSGLLGCATNYRGVSNLETPDFRSSAEQPSIILRGERRSENLAEARVNFDWPVRDARYTRGFAAGSRRPHWGVDLANRRGTEILASERGLVIYAGHGFRGYGKLIVIEHGTEWATLYSHLDKILVKEGEEVKQGQVVGKMGRTGNARGVHLHFEIRQNRQPVNPLAYLPEGFGLN